MQPDVTGLTSADSGPSMQLMPGAALCIRLASAPSAAQSKAARGGSPVAIRGSVMKRWRSALMRSAGVRPCRAGRRQQQEHGSEEGLVAEYALAVANFAV